MTVLIAYATHSGATRTLAEALAEPLREAGLDPVLADVETDPDPAAHDAVVLGSGIRALSVEKSASTWATTHIDALGTRPFAFFSVSGSASDPANRENFKPTDAFLAKLTLHPMAVKNFPGWVIMDKIPLHERLLLKSMRTPVGDFRDLEAVKEWGRHLVGLLGG